MNAGARGSAEHLDPVSLEAKDDGAGPEADLAKSQEARIAARRNRIQVNRLNKLKAGLEQAENVNRRVKKAKDQESEVRKSLQQIQESRKHLESTKLAGVTNISNVRVGVILRESQRRQEEGKKLNALNGKLHEEQATITQLQGTIEQQWQRALTLHGPKRLHEHLAEQQAACARLMEVKQRLLEDLGNELKTKDDDYVKELKRQAEEIQVVLEKMESQYHTFQSTLVQELEQIEKAAVEEREALLNTHITEIERLLTSRRESELKYMHDRTDRVEDHIQQLANLRIRDAEEYNLVKIKLETDVQVLEQQLQQMRATYQLNTEKLEYNYQVLKKREEENGTILSAQKRKINRLQDHLNIIKAKTEKQERSFTNEFNSLTDDYKRLTELHKELQKKVRHFQRVDHKKYRDIWRMNEEAAKDCMHKLLQADRIIHEQQLGLKWQAPEGDAFQSIDLKKLQSNPQEALLLRGMKMAPVGAGGRGEGEGDGEEDASPAAIQERREAFNAKIKEYTGRSKLMKKMLELICNESGFLVEDKLHRLLAPLDKDEQSLMKLDSIFKALAIDSIEAIEKLTHFFILPQEEGERRERERQLSTLEGIRSLSSSKFEIDKLDEASNQLVHPNQVSKALRMFLESQFAEKNKDEEVIQFTRPADVDEADSKSKEDIQRAYWTRMAGIVNDSTYHMWMSVYAAMERYNHVLQDRWNKVEEIKRISHQNGELKALLNQYMTSQVNAELQVPPSKVLLAHAGLSK